MSECELYKQLFARNWRCRRFAWSLSQGCSEKKDVVMTTGRWSTWSIQIPQCLMLRWPAMKAGSTSMTQGARDRVPSGSMLVLPDPRRTDRANPTTNFWWSLFWQHWHDLHALGSHWTDSQHGILCWAFKRGQEEIPSEEATTLQIASDISTRTMHQSTTPSLSQTIWPRWTSRQFLSFRRVVTLLPETFGYSLSSEAVVMRQLRRWKRLWRRSLTHSHKMTSMGPSRSYWNGTSALQPGEITSKGTRVSCVRYQ